jgi:hypothetical protein
MGVIRNIHLAYRTFQDFLVADETRVGSDVCLRGQPYVLSWLAVLTQRRALAGMAVLRFGQHECQQYYFQGCQGIE